MPETTTHPMDIYPPHVQRLKDLIEASPAYRDNPAVTPDLADLLSWQQDPDATDTAKAIRLLDLQALADGCVPQCPRGHGGMELAPPGSPEQQWCGTWWRCPPSPDTCHSSYLDPSLALLMQLESQGSAVTTMSVVNDEGTAMAEATLCVRHHRDPVLRGFAEVVAAGADDLRGPLQWQSSTGNDQVGCVECAGRS